MDRLPRAGAGDGRAAGRPQLPGRPREEHASRRGNEPEADSARARPVTAVTISHEARPVPLKRATLASTPGQTAVGRGRVVRCFPLCAAAFLLFAALAYLLHPAFAAGCAL